LWHEGVFNFCNLKTRRLGMKVLAINGSPKAEGNTALALSTVLKELEAEGIVTETLHIGNKPVRGCLGCGACMKKGDCKCVIPDGANEWIAKMVDADGILLGSPVYYAGINGTLKSFLDRAFYVAAGAGYRMRLKVGAGVVVARRAGTTASLDQLNKYFTIAEMLVPSSNYWNLAHGAAPGEAADDAEGLQIMRILGRNMAWLMKCVEWGRHNLPTPLREEKIKTNFIR
jgi:multimeric flavodoxin WrbA